MEQSEDSCETIMMGLMKKVKAGAEADEASYKQVEDVEELMNSKIDKYGDLLDF